MKRSFISVALILIPAWIGFSLDRPSNAIEFVPQLPHSGIVHALTVSTDGTMLMSCAEDMTVKLWDARSMSLMRELSGHAGWVFSAAFLKNNTRAVSADVDGNLVVWDLETGKKLAASKDGTGQAPAFLIPSSDGNSFFINGDGGVILKYSLADLDNAQSFSGHRATKKWIAYANAAALFDGDRFLATGGLDGEVHVQDLSTGEIETVYTAQEGYTIDSLSVSPRGDRLAVVATNWRSAGRAASACRLVLLEIPTWRALLARDIPSEVRNQGVRFSRSGEYLIADGTPVLVLDSGTGEVLTQLVDSYGVSLGNSLVCPSPTSDGFYSLAGRSGQIELRVLPSADVVGATHVVSGFWPTSVSPDGTTLMYLQSTLDVQSSVTLWSIGRTTVRTVPLAQESNWFLETAALAPDNKSLAAYWSCYKGSTLLHSTNRIIDFSGNAVGPDFADQLSTAMPFTVTGICDSQMAFTPDGRILVKSGCSDGRILVHHLQEPEKDFIFSGHNGTYVYFAISPDGRRVVSRDAAGVWLYWDLEDGQTHPLPEALDEIQLHQGMSYPFCFMPGSGYRLCVTDGGIKVFDLEKDVEPDFYRVLCDNTALAVSPDGTGFLSAFGTTIRYCTATESGAAKSFAGHRDRVRFLAFAPDGKHFWSSSMDHTTRYWDIATGHFVAFVWRPEQWIVYTDDGYWDGSPNCGELVAMVHGLNAYGVDQFAARNNRPDIVLRRLGCTDEALIEHYHNQYLKRLKKLGLAESELSYDPTAVPDTRIVSASQDGRTLSLKVALASRSAALKTWNVWVNDVPLFGAEGKQARGATETVAQAISLNPGLNRIEVGCMNAKGAEAYRTAVYASWNGTAQPRLYYLGFGVSEYANKKLALHWAAKDAKDLAALFSGLQGRGYSEVRARTWTDAEVTPRSIAQAKKLLADARPEDTLVLFISGHGVHDTDANATYYYLTYNADIAHLSRTTVRFEDVEALLQGVAPRSKLFLMDTCESGDADDEPAVQALRGGKGIQVCRVPLRRPQPLPPSVREALAQRGRWIYNDLSRRSGAVVLSSCKANEASYEFDDLQNGVFTAAIKACLADPGADTDHDGVVSSQELRVWVSRRVSELVQQLTGQDLQHPTVDRDNIVQPVGLNRGQTAR